MYQSDFNSNLNLTSIAALGFGGTAQNPVTTTVVQFDYESRSVRSSLFTGLTVENIPAQPSAFIKHVYMPATGTGYTFTYSAFGMIYNASSRRQMTINGSGVISDGVESNSVNFNYQSGSSPALTNAPTFTQRTESATNAPPATYTYASGPGLADKALYHYAARLLDAYPDAFKQHIIGCERLVDAKRDQDERRRFDGQVSNNLCQRSGRPAPGCKRHQL